MPTLTRWYVKSALVFFIAALFIGLAQSVGGFLGGSPLLSALGPVYFHLFMVGWITQLIFGIVFWMFPKYSLERPRGSERLGWGVFILINAGLVLRAFGEPLNSLSPGSIWGWLLGASAIFQWLAGLGFVANTWARVKER
jgi:hypothetical protein